jgi:hypothetical protein
MGLMASCSLIVPKPWGGAIRKSGSGDVVRKDAALAAHK